MTRINAKAMPINDNDYHCHITATNLFNKSYGVHIMPLVINSLRGGHTLTHSLTHSHTHTHTHTHTRTHTHTNTSTNTHTQTQAQTITHTDVHTETILRNQVYTGLWPAHTWFKNIKPSFVIAIRISRCKLLFTINVYK